MVAKNRQRPRPGPWLFLPLEGQEHRTVSQTPAPLGSMQAVSDLMPPGFKFLSKSPGGSSKCTEPYGPLRS